MPSNPAEREGLIGIVHAIQRQAVAAELAGRAGLIDPAEEWADRILALAAPSGEPSEVHAEMPTAGDRARKDYMRGASDMCKTLLTEGGIPIEREGTAQVALRQVIAHWNEFGPEHGLGELLDHAEHWLSLGAPDHTADDVHRTLAKLWTEPCPTCGHAAPAPREGREPEAWLIVNKDGERSVVEFEGWARMHENLAGCTVTPLYAAAPREQEPPACPDCGARYLAHYSKCPRKAPPAPDSSVEPANVGEQVGEPPAPAETVDSAPGEAREEQADIHWWWLRKATIRIGILLSRMRACPAHEANDTHALSVTEGESWIEEQNEWLARIGAEPVSTGRDPTAAAPTGEAARQPTPEPSDATAAETTTPSSSGVGAGEAAWLAERFKAAARLLRGQNTTDELRETFKVGAWWQALQTEDPATYVVEKVIAEAERRFPAPDALRGQGHGTSQGGRGDD